MNRIACMLIAASLAIVHPARSQETPEPHRSTVSVRGSGSVNAVPDQLRLSVQIMTRGESASAAMTEAGKRTRAVLDMLKGYGVEDKDIRTSRVGVTPVYDYEKRIQPPPIISYNGTNEFTVLFRQKQMERVGEFLDRAVTAGASTFGGLIYESSRQRELEREALAAAAADARSRADVLARQLGGTLGRVLSIDELPAGTPRRQKAMTQAFAVEQSQSAAPVMTGELSMSVTVDVIFELK
jgi:uncharacterized protein YggE